MAADPRRIGEVIVIFRMPARAYTEKDKKSLERAAHTCPVHYSLGENVKQTIIFEW